MALPSEVFRKRLKLVRRLKGWTQGQLAAAMGTAGVDLGEPAITRMERGTRGVSLDEAIALAAVLGVSPLHMFVPLDNDASLDVTPLVTMPVIEARAWARGQRPLRPKDDDRLFYAQTPEQDWDAIAPRVAERFSSREDYEQHRARWEREVLYQFARDGGGEITEVPSRPPAPGIRQPVVAAVVTSELGVLVGRRNDGTPPWTFIAREVKKDPAERPEDAAVREVKEETGLDIRVGNVIGERDHPATTRHMIYIAARPAGRSTKVVVGDPAELVEVKWASLAEAGELMPDMFADVREYLEREIGGQ